jgi:hypothetical protein
VLVESASVRRVIMMLGPSPGLGLFEPPTALGLEVVVADVAAVGFGGEAAVLVVMGRLTARLMLCGQPSLELGA